MSVKRYFSIICCGLGMVATMLAQTNLDRSVTVERDFQPAIQPAGKIPSLPSVLNINISKERVEYANFQRVLPFDKSFKPLSAVEVVHQHRMPSRDALIRLGMGNYLNTLGNIAIPLIKTAKTRMDFMVDHVGTFGRKQHSLTNGALNFNSLLSNYDLYAGVGLSHEFFNYYGKNFVPGGDSINLADFAAGLSIPDPTYREQRLERITRAAKDVKLSDLVNAPTHKTLWRFNAHTGIRSLPWVTTNRFVGELSYDMFSSINGLQENIVRAVYGYDRVAGRGRYGMHFELNNMFYRQNNLETLNFWNFYSVFSVNPYYLIENNDWFVRLGFKSAFSFIHGKPFNPSPDITAELKVLPELLSVYGGLTGEYSLSTLNSIFAENRYVFPDLRVKDTYTPLIATLGFKLKAHPNLLIDAFSDYRVIDDQYFFVNKEYKTADIQGLGETIFINRFNAIYSDANLFRFGLRANFNYRNTINIQARGVYNNWSVKSERYAWLKPALQGELHADWKLNRNINLTANLHYDGPKFAKLGDVTHRVDPIVDMNMGASYSFNRAFSLFARLNNVFNNKYEHFYGYQVQGINFLLGGTVSF